MSPDELAHCLDMINTVVGRNSCGAIMEAVGEAGIAMCQDVLLVDPNTIGYTSNEDLFMPGKHENEIRKIVKRLNGKFGADEVRFQSERDLCLLRSGEQQNRFSRGTEDGVR